MKSMCMQIKYVWFFASTAIGIVSMSHAQPFSIDLRASSEGVELQYTSRGEAYYQFEKSTALSGESVGWSIVDMALGGVGARQWLDGTIATADERAYYRVREVPYAASEDTDGDGIGDVYELRFPLVLNPLRNGDEAGDPDGDSISNADEFKRGSDPTTIDPPVWTMETPFDGMIIGGY